MFSVPLGALPALVLVVSLSYLGVPPLVKHLSPLVVPCGLHLLHPRRRRLASLLWLATVG
jgi:hypothetical protein